MDGDAAVPQYGLGIQYADHGGEDGTQAGICGTQVCRGTGEGAVHCHGVDCAGVAVVDVYVIGGAGAQQGDVPHVAVEVVQQFCPTAIIGEGLCGGSETEDKCFICAHSAMKRAERGQQRLHVQSVGQGDGEGQSGHVEVVLADHFRLPIMSLIDVQNASAGA